MNKTLLPFSFILFLQILLGHALATPYSFNTTSNDDFGPLNKTTDVTKFTAGGFGKNISSLAEFSDFLPSVVLSGALTGDFSNLRDAFEAINTGGGSGNVTVTIQENTTETSYAILNETNYVVEVVPQGNRIVQGNLSIALIVLEGADNVTFNGQTLFGTNTLTFRNTSSGANSSVVRLQGSCSNNIFRKCIIEGGGSSNSNFAAGIALADGISGVSSSTGNILDSNLIRPSTSSGLSQGISVGSANGNLNNTFTNTQITNNLIENVFCNTSSRSTGIYINNNAINTEIRGNSIYSSNTYNNSINNALYYGIWVNSLFNTVGGGNTIDSNYIGGSAPLATGSKMIIHSPVTRMQMIAFLIQENVTATGTFITRNVINNLSVSTINNVAVDLIGFAGIFVNAANLQAFNHNTLGSAVNNSVSLATNPGSSARIINYGIATQVACATPIANNFLGGINITATAPVGISGSPQFFGLFTRDAAVTNLQNNIIGAAVPNSISVISNAPSDFRFYALNNYAAVGSSIFNISNNIVRNISGSNTTIAGILQENWLVGTTNVSGTMTGNTVSDINVTGSPNNVVGIGYNTFSGVNSLVHDLNFTNNQVKNISASSGSNNLLRAINIANETSSVNRIKGRIEGNLVSNIINNTGGTTGISRGINFSNDIVPGDSMVIAANNISELTDASERIYLGSLSTANSQGIAVAMPNSGENGIVVVRDNIIHNIKSTSLNEEAIRTNGLSVFGNSAIIERNIIYALQNTATSATARIEPILLRSRSDDAAIALVRNNMVAANSNTQAQVAGIRIQEAATKSNIYHNSILLEGTSINNSYALLKEGSATADVKNNILYNAVTGTGNAFAVGLETNANGYTGSNNYVVSPATTSLMQLGAVSHTLATWQAATSQEANTQQGQSGVTTQAADLFTNTSTATLFINTAHLTEPVKVSDKGMALSAFVPNDFLNIARNVAAPDIGAHEFLFTGALPLHLLSFNGTKENLNAKLQWQTANEWNVNRFEVERSTEGNKFETIGALLPGLNTYTFMDVNIFNIQSTVFYRLKSIDADGKFNYSGMIRLVRKVETQITLYPNPVKDIVTVSGLQKNGTLSLFTTEGKLLKKQMVTAQNEVLDMSGYIKGVYLLQYSGKDESVNMKIVKNE